MCAITQISEKEIIPAIMRLLQNYDTVVYAIFQGGGIECLIKEEILASLYFTDLDHCVDCIHEKYVKHIKNSGATRSLGVLEIIHTNICGPLIVRPVDGFNSFITFTDDFSRYRYIYLIRERSEAVDKFKIFKVEVKNQYNAKIKVVRSD
jgi:hypothetical protein